MRMLATISLSLATAFSGIVPAQAYPIFSGPKIVSSDVQQVRDRRWYRHSGRNWDRGRHWNGNRYAWRGDRYRYGGGYRGGYRPYYGGGYGGYRYGPYYGGYYRGYDDDFGAVIGGLAAGAIIGGLVAQPRYAPRYYGGNTHVSWCYARYRSYRAFDDTFQPYYGPRRQCVSPY